MVAKDLQPERNACEHDMEDAMLETIGPPSLGIRKPDGSADVLNDDGHQLHPQRLRELGFIRGSRCRKCGFEIPKNTAAPAPS